MTYAISKDGMVKVEWTDLGEGLSGDYDPSDPEDISLLRYDAWVRITGTDEDERRGLEAACFRRAHEVSLPGHDINSRINDLFCKSFIPCSASPCPSLVRRGLTKQKPSDRI